MPKSKRDKRVSLTDVVKKPGMETKVKLVQKVRDLVDQYARVFVVGLENQRTYKMQKIRYIWNHSRFLFGKNKVMMIALGKTAEGEYRDNLSQLGAHLRGQTGLLFTNKTKEDVLKFFKSYAEIEFARSGCIAKQTVIVREGPVEDLSFSMEPNLRSLGMPTTLTKGIIHMTQDFTVCKKGVMMTPEQARILKVFGHKSVYFRLVVKCMWSNDGTFEEFEDDAEVELLQETLSLEPEKYTYEFLDSDEEDTDMPVMK